MKERLAQLREHLAAHRLDGFLVPTADPHLSEYLPPEFQRPAWLTGFTGSAGTAIVLRDRALLLTDGRYRVQAAAEIDPALWELAILPEETAGAWLARHARGARLGFDPWTLSPDGLAGLLKGADVEAVPVRPNPLDALWTDRPEPRLSRPYAHTLERAGRPAADKLGEIGQAAAAAGADAALLTALDSLAWVFNLRGSDLSHTPVARGWALIAADGRATLWMDGLNEATGAALPGVDIRPYGALAVELGTRAPARVLVDPRATALALVSLLEEAGAAIVHGTDPVAAPRAAKNPVEVAGARAAHHRDGAALVAFLAWFDTEVPRGTLTEAGAAARLEAFRQRSPLYHGPSFDTIAGWGPHGAVVHYRVTPSSDLAIRGDGLFLIDSGAQYPDGTTDVTRTIAVGTPPHDARRAATLVLKGHVALARQRFPRGTRGIQLDALARQHLWAAGLDYAHGTGHGVGSFLSVHEGPQRIAASAAFAGGAEPLVPGMIVSNEPGHYVEGRYGVRHENLMLVVEAPAEADEQSMLGFETLTLAPFDRRLIDAALLDSDERAWIDAYHARVRDAHSPELDEVPRAWLARACEPLASG